MYSSTIEEILRKDIPGLKERLKAILVENSVQIAPEDQPFTLASGKKSHYYINGKLTTSDPEGLYCLSRIILEEIKEKQVEAIGGPTLGADPIVSGVTILSHLYGQSIPLFIVRKEPKGHGTQSQVEGCEVQGKRVVLVEDVITTGGSLLKAVDVVQTLGGIIVNMISIVDREQGGREAFAKAGLSYTPIFSIKELLPEEVLQRTID